MIATRGATRCGCNLLASVPQVSGIKDIGSASAGGDSLGLVVAVAQVDQDRAHQAGEVMARELLPGGYVPSTRRQRHSIPTPSTISSPPDGSTGDTGSPAPVAGTGTATETARTLLLLVVKLASPEKTAPIEWLAAEAKLVMHVATPAVTVWALHPEIATPASVNSTVPPSGAGDTVAVSVVDEPGATGLGDADTETVVAAT